MKDSRIFRALFVAFVFVGPSTLLIGCGGGGGGVEIPEKDEPLPEQKPETAEAPSLDLND